MGTRGSANRATTDGKSAGMFGVPRNSARVRDSGQVQKSGPQGLLSSSLYGRDGAGRTGPRVPWCPRTTRGGRDEAAALQVAAVSPGVTASIFPTSIFATCSAVKDKLAKKSKRDLH